MYVNSYQRISKVAVPTHLTCSPYVPQLAGVTSLLIINVQETSYAKAIMHQGTGASAAGDSLRRISVVTTDTLFTIIPFRISGTVETHTEHVTIQGLIIAFTPHTCIPYIP